MKKAILFSVSLAFVSVAFAGTPTALTGDQLKTSFVGKTFRLVWTDGKQQQSGSQTLAADGTSSLKMDSGYTDTGTWTIKSNLVCSTWSKKKKQDPCAPIWDIGDGKFMWKGKGQSTTFMP